MRNCKTKINKQKFYDILSIPSNPEDLFTLLYPIGNGGFGKVYKAMHNDSKEIYAIKIIDYTKGNSNDKSNISFNYKSIQQETSLMRLVNKSNYVIKYYGSYYSRYSNTIWLILEYCSSGSAVDLMLSMGRTLSEVEVSTIIEMVLKGLMYIHKLNLIHRDIKGANIMLSEDGYAKLGDFGIGIQITDDEFRTSQKGSPHWMSPQVILNNKYDMKTDIWSLGITCLELVEGEPPFSDLNPDEVMEQVAKNPPKAENIIDPKEHTKDFINFVNLCLEINPNKRPSADILIKHPFIKKLSKGKEYLSKLIENHIDEVEKFRFDREEYLNLKENMENENIINNEDSEESMHIKNSYSAGYNNGGINIKNRNIHPNINDNNYDEIINDNNSNKNINDDKNNMDKKIKCISILSNDKNNLNDCSFKKNNIFENKIKNNKIKQKNEFDITKNKKKELMNNNFNSNGGKTETCEENIRDSSEEEKMNPINHSILNANFEINKLEHSYDNKKANDIKKNLKIPSLNLKNILKNENESEDLNTHDSPTHTSIFSLINAHKKYFD